jgi:hypothetical protein
MMKFFASLSVFIGLVFLCLGIAGIQSISFNSSEGASIVRVDGVVQQMASILISSVFVVGGYGVLKRIKWAYWFVLVVVALISAIFVVQGIYIALTFNTLAGRIWGIVSQWIIAWLIFHFLIRGYWLKKKPYFMPQFDGNTP